MSWITAFKVIPWGDVLAAAPAVAQGAKKLWSSVRKSSTDLAEAEPASLESRLHALQAEVAELKQENAASSDLIKSLAEQNARLVEVVGVLKTRTQVLFAVSGILSLVALALALWSLYR